MSGPAERGPIAADEDLLPPRAQDGSMESEAAGVQARFLLEAATRLFVVPSDGPSSLSLLGDLACPLLADYAAAFWRDDEQGLVRVATAAEDPSLQAALAAAPPAPPPLNGLEHLDGWSLPPEESTTAPAVMLEYFEKHRRRYGATSLLVLPVRAGSETLGAMVLGRIGVRSPEERKADLELATRLAEQAGRAAHNHQRLHEAERAARLRDDVLAVVSHDLRSPLNVIELTLHSVLKHWETVLANPAAGHRQLEIAKDAATRTKRMVRDLLDVAQIESGSLAVDVGPIDLQVLLNEALELHTPAAAEADIRLTMEVEPGLPPAVADADRLLQALGNLIDNAIHHTLPGGQIYLRARRTGAAVRLEVSDTGCGIGPEELKRVFDRFWRRARGRKTGVGLGLAITKGITDALGGEIDVESREGEGSTFAITLPAQQPAD